MSNLKSQISCRLVVLILLVSLSPCLLVQDTLAQVPAVTTGGRAGNYCIECHVAGDTRLDRAFEWQGGVGREQVSPCPTLKKLREELYYTESLLGALTNSGQALRRLGVSTAPMDKRVLARLESYERLTQEPVTALAPVETELKSLRLQMNKSFSQMYQGWDWVNTRWAILAAAVVTLLVAGTAVWRLCYPTMNRRADAVKGDQSPSANAASSPLQRALHFQPGNLLPGLVGMIIAFLLFALPVFSTAAPTSTAQTDEQARRQDALNEAAKAAESAERASARAWMLARIGASWARVDQAKGQAALEAGLAAFDEFQMNAPAYWGRVHQLEEDAVTWTAGQDAARDAADRIAVAASRAWALRAMAGDWAAVDRAKSVELLTQARAVAAKNPNAYYRNADLYAIAVEWGRLDKNDGVNVARALDPVWQAAALRDMGLFEPAWQSARQAPLVEKIWSLQALGKSDAVKGAPALSEAQALIAELPQPQDRAFALRNLAAAGADVDAARAAQAAGSIDAAYPEVKASALLAARQFEPAIEQARRIERAYRRDQALAAIARAWAAGAPSKALDIAQTIQNAHLRADVQRAAAQSFSKPNPGLALQTAQAITAPALKATALIELGQFEAALALADQLQDGYPMRELAVVWARTDLDRALQAVEKIQRDVDRAAALREIAVIAAAKDKAQANALFDRALQAAQAMRRSGDPFASAEALRQLGAAWTAIDKARAEQAFTAAFESAQRVSVKY